MSTNYDGPSLTTVGGAGTSWTFTIDGFQYLVSRMDFEPPGPPGYGMAEEGLWKAFCGEHTGLGASPQEAVEKLSQAVSALPNAPHKRVVEDRTTVPAPEP